MRGMKRIVIVTDAWHPQVNGVVTTYEALRVRVQKRGYEVSIVHPGLFTTVPLPVYPEIRLAVFPRRKLARMLDEIRPDAIHVATEGPLGFAARSICRRRGVQFTSAYHTHFHLYAEARLHVSWPTPFFTFLVRRFHRAACRTMVPSPSMQHDLEQRAFSNLVIWPIGVDTKLFTRNLTPRVPQLEKPVFVYFGRLAIEKNVDEFFSTKLRGTKLVIGDGPDRKRLEARFGHEVRFVGYKYGQELVDWLSICDVLVFPSDTETTGLVVLESLACGIPVAAHNVRGPSDIILDGETGILSNDLAKAAEQALRLDRDACRASALRYSWERSVDIFLKNLRSINWRASTL